MAQKITVVYVDDIDGKEISDSTNPTISFALDGTTYEIDLSDSHQDELRTALEPFIQASRKTGARRGTRRTTPSAPTTAAASAAEVRAWANSNGLVVPDRGRIPAEVREAYQKA